MDECLCMKDLEMFQDFNTEEKWQIVRLAEKKLYPKGSFIFHQGDIADNIYLIQSGMVQLIKVTDDGKEVVLDILQKGDIWGEHTIFEESVFGFYAKTLTDAFVCMCGSKEFLKLLSDPVISLKVIKRLSGKLNNYLKIAADNAFIDAKGRIFNTLKRLSTSNGKATNKGLMLNFYLSHEDLALLVNASRVTVTNSIAQLKDEGAIEIYQRKFIVCHY